jgi:parallel beta-helix repeat protein
MFYRNTNLAVTLSLALFALSQVAAGATLCVSNHPSPGCPYSTIGAAVAAAKTNDVIQVSQGVYHEDVVIGIPLSLIGATFGNTVIDATGKSNGIYVDGYDNAGLTGVVVSGFTVQNANFEGILLTNVSDATITGNQVLHNDLSVDINTSMCPGQPAFETLEGDDCGEGIHLLGVDHSVISNNLVQNNSGGILLSDDTGATHDNLIMGNTVQNNPFDCGITLASHPLVGSNFTAAAGVYHNTINGNTSQHNGYQVPGAGAGVGIFAPFPFSKTYGNVVVNNTLTDNGLPGVAFHAHAPGATLSDNMIAGNQISGNGADTADTATSGPTGINVSGGDTGTVSNTGIPVAVITGTVIAGNVIQRETDGVATKTSALVGAHLNSFIYVKTGVDNIDPVGGSVDATFNWWGCPGGPTSPACASVSGINILYLPFLDTPLLNLPFPF